MRGWEGALRSVQISSVRIPLRLRCRMVIRMHDLRPEPFELLLHAAPIERRKVIFLTLETPHGRRHVCQQMVSGLIGPNGDPRDTILSAHRT
jgi:hypothetical protein